MVMSFLFLKFDSILFSNFLFNHLAKQIDFVTFASSVKTCLLIDFLFLTAWKVYLNVTRFSFFLLFYFLNYLCQQKGKKSQSQFHF